MYVISFGPEAEAWLGFWAFVQAPKLLSKAGELELFRWSLLRFMEGPRGATGGNLRNWRGSEGRSAGARGGEAAPLSEFGMDPVSALPRIGQVSNEPPHVHHQSALIACPVHLSESSPLAWT
ncbi:hypothetical protein B0T13DRAFT_491857 [Neurospora crassa]|nr:hypothetical protein B0T13DRAFT_491857 [Neurospora crassa]